MTKSNIIIAAATAALLAGCGMGADYPEFSEASYRIEGMTADPNGGPPTHTVIYRNGPQMRVEAVLPQYGDAVIVFDQATNAAYVLTDASGAAAAVSAAPAAGAPSSAAPGQTATTPQATAPNTTASTTPDAAAPAPTATAQPVGVAVRLADADAPQPMETVWAALGEENARRVGRCEVAGEDGNEWEPRGAATGVERTACITDDGIVLRVRENDIVLWEASALERGQQDANLFGVPSNYQIIDPEAVAEGVGERMEQLDSVTGAPPTPQQAPDARG